MNFQNFIKISIIFALYAVPLLFAPFLPITQLIVSLSIITVCLLVLHTSSILGFLGIIDYSRGNHEGATGYFKLAILKDSKNPRVFLDYAMILIQQEQYEEALVHLKASLAVNNSNKLALTISSTIAEVEDHIREQCSIDQHTDQIGDTRHHEDNTPT